MCQSNGKSEKCKRCAAELVCDNDKLSKNRFTYEVVNCNDEIETVTGEFQSEYGDLTSYDDRTPVSIDSMTYIRLKD